MKFKVKIHIEYFTQTISRTKLTCSAPSMINVAQIRTCEFLSLIHCSRMLIISSKPAGLGFLSNRALIKEFTSGIELLMCGAR